MVKPRQKVGERDNDSTSPRRVVHWSKIFLHILPHRFHRSSVHFPPGNNIGKTAVAQTSGRSAFHGSSNLAFAGVIWSLFRLTTECQEITFVTPPDKHQVTRVLIRCLLRQFQSNLEAAGSCCQFSRVSRERE